MIFRPRNILRSLNRQSSLLYSFYHSEIRPRSNSGNVKLLFKSKEINNFQVSTRTLYSEYLLGIEGFRQSNEELRKGIFFKADKFETMISKSVEDEKSVLFTGDIKNLIALCEVKPELLDLTLKATKKYSNYANQINIEPFRFGPLIMRLLYCMRSPEVALEVFKNNDFRAFFKQASTYQIIMDLMFDAQCYEEVKEIADDIIDNDLFHLPQSCLALALAANCKINTKGSLEHSLHLLRCHSRLGKNPTFRSISFVAYHALLQNQFNEVMELISMTNSSNHFLILNIELLTKCHLGRIQEVLETLRVRALIDTPKMTKHSHRVIICNDVLDQMEKMIMDKVILDAAADSESILHAFNRLKTILENSKLIQSTNLEEAIFSSIDVPEYIRLKKDIRKMKSSPTLRPVSKWD